MIWLEVNFNTMEFSKMNTSNENKQGITKRRPFYAVTKNQYEICKQFQEECDHVYTERTTAPLGVICVKCDNFVGAWE